MTTTRAKGASFERWGAAILREAGWKVHLCGRKAKMIGPGKLITVGNDIFGCDLVGVRTGFKTLFIQFTMDSGVSKRLQEFVKIPWDLEHQDVQLWQKKPGGSVVCLRFDGSSFREYARFIRGKFFSAEIMGGPMVAAKEAK